LGLGGDREASPATTFDLSGTLADVSRRASTAAESEKVRQVLDEVGGDRRLAAELLSVSKKTLLHKMRDFGLAEKANETKVVPPSGREYNDV
jgi:DNA-binding NtrC family response regulator